jgi:hypothetical protein
MLSVIMLDVVMLSVLAPVRLVDEFAFDELRRLNPFLLQKIVILSRM